MSNQEPLLERDEQTQPISDVDKFLNEHYDKPFVKPMWKQKAEAREALLTLIEKHTKQARIEAIDPYAERLGQWLQPELMTDYEYDQMDEDDLRRTVKRYADYLMLLDRLTLDTLAKLNTDKGKQ